MDLKFVSATKPQTVPIAVQRRQRLVRRIDQQIGYVRQMIDGESPRASWVWMDEEGKYYVPIKYGRHTIELKKGMFAILCQNLDEVEHAFCTIRAMVFKGDLDDQINKAATAIRSAFKG
jgi:hypothetical protein